MNGTKEKAVQEAAEVPQKATEADQETDKTPPAIEADQSEETRAKVEAEIIALQHADRLLTALTKTDVSSSEVLATALEKGPSVSALTQALIKQMTPKQIQEVNDEVMQSPTGFSEN